MGVTLGGLRADELSRRTGLRAWTRLARLGARAPLDRCAVALAAAAAYFTVASDYAYLKASVYTGAPTGAISRARGTARGARAQEARPSRRRRHGGLGREHQAASSGENGHCDPAFAFVQDGVPVPDDAGLQTLGRLPQPEFAASARAARARHRDVRGPQGRVGRHRSGRLRHGLSDAASAGELRPQGARTSSRPITGSRRRRSSSTPISSIWRRSSWTRTPS